MDGRALVSAPFAAEELRALDPPEGATVHLHGGVTRIEGDYVFVRWIKSDFGETEEYQAHSNDVTPLAGWL